MAKQSGSRKKGPTATTPSSASVGPVVVPPAQPDAAHKFLEWIQRHQRQLYMAAVSVLVVAVGAWSVFVYQRNKEAQARRELEQARFAVQTENYALAASDLSRIVATRVGTRAADEAVVLLGQVRLQQNEPTVAAGELRVALERGMDPEFRSPAYGLLGAALETIGSYPEAARAYLEAANTCWYDYIAAQYLNDAGRAFWAAGDAVEAVAAYERVVAQYSDAPSATEARVRLGELRAQQQGSQD